MLDFDKLTLGEIQYLERSTGASFAQIEENLSSGKLMTSSLLIPLAYVAAKRSGKTEITKETVLDLTLDEAIELIGIDDMAEESTEDSKSI